MVLDITQADIDQSIPGDCLRDAIATALHRQTGHRWRVDAKVIHPDIKGCKVYATPRAAVRLIEAQDNGQPVTPTTIELR